jgi:outer membrane immunogenic protein
VTGEFVGLPRTKETTMKTSYTFLTSTLLGLTGGQPALAGCLTPPTEEPPVFAQPAPFVAPSADWSGGYVGAQVGYGDLNSNGAGLDGNGAIGGLHAGYRVDFGQFVTGRNCPMMAPILTLGPGPTALILSRG